MTSGWKTVKLGELCTTVSDTYHGNDSEVILINTSDVLNGKILNHSKVPNQNLRGQFKKTFKKDDILYSEIRPANKRYAFVDIEDTSLYIASTKLMVLRPNKALVEPKFLMELLTTKQMLDELQHLAETRSGTFPQITFNSELAPRQVSLPPLDVQRRIAAVLRPLDDKIELNARINAQLERVAQALFKRHFVRFEGSGGTMPPSWRVGTLGEIAHITMGQSPDGKSYNDKGIGTVFFQGRTDFGFRFPTVRLFTTEPKRMAKKRDVLLSVRAPVGDVNEAHEDCCIGRGLAAIQSKNGCQSFLLYTMFSLKKQLEVFNAEGTVFGCINRDSLNAMPILIPTDDAIKEFERIVAPMDEMIRSNTDESRTLARLRDVLLPRLMSGEVDVGRVSVEGGFQEIT